MRTRLTIRVVAVICAAAIVAAGCGSDGDGGEPTDAALGETTSAVSTTAAPEAEATETAEPTPEGPLVPMAVVGLEPNGELVARSSAGASNERVRSIVAFSMDVGIVPDSARDAEGSTWLRIGSADSRDVDGWVDAGFLIEVEGDLDQPEPLFTMASSVRNALSQADAANRLADRIRTLRVSLDGTFTLDDPELTADQLSRDDPALHDFGIEPRTGAAVVTDATSFFDEFGTTKALQQTDRISINTRVNGGEFGDNSAEFFPDSTVVELYYAGDEGTEDTTWESVLMVFAPNLNTGATSTRVVDDSTAFELVGLTRLAPVG